MYIVTFTAHLQRNMVRTPHFSGASDATGLHPKFHFIFLMSFLWCNSRFRPWPMHLFSPFITTPFGSVISKNSIKYHLYGDDTQLYISFTPSNSTSSLEMLSNTFSDILISSQQTRKKWANVGIHTFKILWSADAFHMPDMTYPIWYLKRTFCKCLIYAVI